MILNARYSILIVKIDLSQTLTPNMDIRAHWDHIYQTKAPNQVSWYQEHPYLSMQFIRRTGVALTGRIIDVGGGASTLVDNLLDAGFQHVTVLDISPTALQAARQRLGQRAAAVTWIEADILHASLPYHFYDVWYDRAVFHFLTRVEDRQRYLEAVRQAVRAGGHVIVASFAEDGPQHCSGLEVMRYSPESLQVEFGPDFRLLDSAREVHRTPSGAEQRFIYCYCRKV